MINNETLTLHPDAISITIESFKTEDFESIYISVSDQIIVGRSKNKCDIAFNDRLVSPQHFVLEYEDKKLFVFNVNAENETYVNGFILNSKRELRRGDIIAFGSLEAQIIF